MENDALIRYDAISAEIHKARKKILASHGLTEKAYSELRENAALQVAGYGPAGARTENASYLAETKTKLIATRR